MFKKPNSGGNYELTPDWEIIEVHLVPVVVLDGVLEVLQLVLSDDHGAVLGLGNVGWKTEKKLE